MTARSEKSAVKLDWSRLLGFDQAEPISDGKAASALNDPRLAKLGAKFGVKLGRRAPPAAAR